MTTLDSRTGALEGAPDPGEVNVRVRMTAKGCIMKALIEERLSRANSTHQQQVDQTSIEPPCSVDIWRTPERKDQEGWRGPADLVHILKDRSSGVVVWQGYPYLIPMRHIRNHRASFLAMIFSSGPSGDMAFLLELFDIVDGTAGFDVKSIGEFKRGNEMILIPEDLRSDPPRVW